MATINFNSAAVNNNSAVATENKPMAAVANISVRKEAKPLSWGIMSGCKSFKTPVSVSTAIKEVEANYKVDKQSLVRVPEAFIESIKNGTPYMGSFSENDIITTHMATYREDNNKTLGVVGANYGVVQNEKAFEFIDIITSGELGGDKPVIETAGVLGYGERMFVTAKMPKNMLIDGDNKSGIEDYILFTNSHDGSGAVTALFTPVRVICQNTLNLALKQAKNKLIFKHTANVNTRLDWDNKENIEKAVAVLKMHEHYKKEFLNNLYNLSQKKIENDTEIIDFSAKVLATPAQYRLLKLANFDMDKLTTEELSTRNRNSINALCDTIESGVGQDEFRGTKLWLYNGLTSYLGNEKKYKTEEDKMNSIVLGGDANKKMQRGFDLLMAI